MAAVAQNGYALEFASSELRNTLIQDMATELIEARRTIAEFHSVPVINLVTNQEETMLRPISFSSSSSSSTPPTKKRKHQPREQSIDFQVAVQKITKVKVEKINETLHDVREDLEDA